jgi:hypothetical protein
MNPMKFVRLLKNAISFSQLPRCKRRLVFYSEGKNYWVHLEGLIRELLRSGEIGVCYLSSGRDDPGLLVEHSCYRSYWIGEGSIRDWLFQNMDADVMVMTMPDLHQYQVKRSKNPVHYVYVQHSLVSLHMIYRGGAFDHFDTIFCSGEHHMKEIRAMEEVYRLPEKNLVRHGYGRLDSIISEAAKLSEKKEVPELKHVLIAPSWGPNCIIETIGLKVVDILMTAGCQVTLRPHPQTIKYSFNTIKPILDRYNSDNRFCYEENVAGQESLIDSDVMICDWSGAALDYAFGLGKPVLFIDVPRKVNNPDYKKIEIEPFESLIRNKIGVIVDSSDLDKITTLLNSEIKPTAASEYVFSVGESSRIGAEAIMGILQKP